VRLDLQLEADARRRGEAAAGKEIQEIVLPPIHLGLRRSVNERRMSVDSGRVGAGIRRDAADSMCPLETSLVG